MSADGDDNVVRKPVIVHGLIVFSVALLRCFLADRVEPPIQFVEINISHQWAERSSLWSTDSAPTGFQYLFQQMHDLGVFHTFCDLPQKDGVPNCVEVFGKIDIDNGTHSASQTTPHFRKGPVR